MTAVTLDRRKVCYEGPDMLDVPHYDGCALCGQEGQHHIACQIRALVASVRNNKYPMPPELDAPNFLAHHRNIAGNPTSFFVCQECHTVFSLCPALWPGETVDEFCLSEDCPSYRIDRDPLALQYLGDAGPLIGRDIS